MSKDTICWNRHGMAIEWHREEEGGETRSRWNGHRGQEGTSGMR